MQKFSFLDVTGIGNSGKSAVVDLLREYDDVYPPAYGFEFDFLRVPNGLLDLRYRLVSDWSPLRAHYAIGAFLDVADKMGRDPSWWELPGLMRSSSHRYDKRFGGKFRKLSNEFALSFVRTSFTGDWPYDGLSDSDGVRLVRKLLRRLRLKKLLHRPVYIPDGKDFDAKAEHFLSALYATIVPQGKRIIAFNNCFEPFNPVSALDMLGDARQIVVVRDPRDIYMSGIGFDRAAAEAASGSFNYASTEKTFLGAGDLKGFTERLRIYSNHQYKRQDPRVLRLRFEDVVLNYERTKQEICAFLRISPTSHTRPFESFQPEKSARNIGLWRQYPRKDELDYIAAELPELVYPT